MVGNSDSVRREQCAAGRYRLSELIGRGGMGRVWRARDEMLDRWVAVKEIRIDELAGESGRIQRERSLREARATARIDHPHVVRVYDVAEEGDRLWIVMQLVQAPSLEHVLSEGRRLGPGEAARVGRGLAAALREVHAVGVLHRDIKPGNVLIDARGGVVLTDFGIAAIQDAAALTMAGVLVGSPDYMAPERVEGREQGPPSDLWSLGATLCAALAGESPFSRASTLATLHAVLYEEPEIPAAAGPLTGILTALLRKDPRDRPTVEEVDAALAPFAAPPPAQLPDTAPPHRTPTVIDPRASEVPAPGAAATEAPGPEAAESGPETAESGPEAAAPVAAGTDVPARDARIPDARIPDAWVPDAPSPEEEPVPTAEPEPRAVREPEPRAVREPEPQAGREPEP
ncbi:serine/threonine protein kinase, partial [Streptomyces sp. Ru73]